MLGRLRRGTAWRSLLGKLILTQAQFKSFGSLIGSLQGAIIPAVLLRMLRNILALL